VGRGSHDSRQVSHPGQAGPGGMATVYKALHVGFDEVCALKVINQELASDLSFVKRFGQEAALTRKLQHPNAVRVEDIDQADDGRPFMVMEFIEGESLKDVIQHQAPLPVPRACRIAKQVAAALDAAHRLGMIHRDIKPGNILLTRPRRRRRGRGTGQSPRFRHRQDQGSAPGRRRCDAHADRHFDWHARLHVAGTGHGQDRRGPGWPRRPLLAGRGHV
jgi:serine/threonine protein kinase